MEPHLLEVEGGSDVPVLGAQLEEVAVHLGQLAKAFALVIVKGALDFNSLIITRCN